MSSLTFRLAFADNFGDAINSEVRSSIFLTHNFNGFSFNVAALNDNSFLTVNPVQTSVSLRNAPEARFSSVDRSPFANVPVYFSFDAFAGALHRNDGVIDTPAAVPRLEFAPRMTVPLHFGPWLDVTATAAFRTSYYGDSLVPGSILTTPVLSPLSITRNDGEFGLDFRLPVIQRYFQKARLDEKIQTHHRAELRLPLRHRHSRFLAADSFRFRLHAHRHQRDCSTASRNAYSSKTATTSRRN